MAQSMPQSELSELMKVVHDVASMLDEDWVATAADDVRHNTSVEDRDDPDDIFMFRLEEDGTMPASVAAPAIAIAPQSLRLARWPSAPSSPAPPARIPPLRPAGTEQHDSFGHLLGMARY